MPYYVPTQGAPVAQGPQQTQGPAPVPGGAYAGQGPVPTAPPAVSPAYRAVQPAGPSFTFSLPFLGNVPSSAPGGGVGPGGRVPTAPRATPNYLNVQAPPAAGPSLSAPQPGAFGPYGPQAAFGPSAPPYGPSAPPYGPVGTPYAPPPQAYGVQAGPPQAYGLQAGPPPSAYGVQAGPPAYYPPSPYPPAQAVGTDPFGQPTDYSDLMPDQPEPGPDLEDPAFVEAPPPDSVGAECLPAAEAMCSLVDCVNRAESVGAVGEDIVGAGYVHERRVTVPEVPSLPAVSQRAEALVKLAGQDPDADAAIRAIHRLATDPAAAETAAGGDPYAAAWIQAAAGEMVAAMSELAVQRAASLDETVAGDDAPDFASVLVRLLPTNLRAAMNLIDRAVGGEDAAKSLVKDVRDRAATGDGEAGSKLRLLRRADAVRSASRPDEDDGADDQGLSLYAQGARLRQGT